MDLQTRKISFIQEFLQLQNEGIISNLEDILKKHKAKVFESGLKPMNLKQFESDINQALEDSKKDNVIKAADLKSKYA